MYDDMIIQQYLRCQHQEPLQSQFSYSENERAPKTSQSHKR